MGNAKRRNGRLLAMMAFLFLFPATTRGAETWTLAMQSELKSVTTNMDLTLSANASVALAQSAAGTFSGTGNATVQQVSNGAGYNSTCTGQGPITVTAQPKGSDLILVIAESFITCTGTAVVFGKSEPYEYIAETDDLFASAQRAVIERKNGAANTMDVNVGSGLTVKTTISLAGIDAPAKAADTACKSAGNLWTMEVESSGAGAGDFTMKGSAEFNMPAADGTVSGTGQFTFEQNGTGSSLGTGEFSLSGHVKDGTLSFIPRAVLKKMTMKNNAAGESIQMDYAQGMDLFDNTADLTMPVKDGAELSAQEAPNRTTTFRLTGKRRELWRVIIEGADKHMFGTSSSMSGGVRVNWRVTMKIEIVDGKYESGTGECVFAGIDSVSNPPGVVACKSVAGVHYDDKGNASKTPCMFQDQFKVADGSAGGGRLSLTLFKHNQGDGLGYAADYECTVDEKRAADKVPGWGRLNYRKSYKDRAIMEFPNAYTVTLKDGWTTSEGVSDAFNYEKITVQRIRCE